MSDTTFICTYHRVTKINKLEDYTKINRFRTSNLNEEHMLPVHSAFIISYLCQNRIPKTLNGQFGVFFSILEQFQISDSFKNTGDVFQIL